MPFLAQGAVVGQIPRHHIVRAKHRRVAARGIAGNQFYEGQRERDWEWKIKGTLTLTLLEQSMKRTTQASVSCVWGGGRVGGREGVVPREWERKRGREGGSAAGWREVHFNQRVSHERRCLAFLNTYCHPHSIQIPFMLGLPCWWKTVLGHTDALSAVPPPSLRLLCGCVLAALSFTASHSEIFIHGDLLSEHENMRGKCKAK